MAVEWVRRGTWAVCLAAWAMLILDALPWGLDLTGGCEGIVRIVALLAPAALWVERGESKPAQEIYEAGYDAGRRAAAEALRARLGSSAGDRGETLAAMALALLAAAAVGVSLWVGRRDDEPDVD